MTFSLTRIENVIPRSALQGKSAEGARGILKLKNLEPGFLVASLLEMTIIMKWQERINR